MMQMLKNCIFTFTFIDLDAQQNLTWIRFEHIEDFNWKT